MLTFEELKNDAQVLAYIAAGDKALEAIGYTEHSASHLDRTAETAARILADFSYPERTAELAKIAALLHDMGNMINREGHAQTGAIIASRILERRGMPYGEVAQVVTAIGNHDEETGRPVNEIAAALILADKSDVRRSRVRGSDIDKILADIHDRVNYAAVKSGITVEPGEDNRRRVVLSLEIDTSFCPVMDYFEIFLSRMLMCRRAAMVLDSEFELVINGLKVL